MIHEEWKTPPVETEGKLSTFLKSLYQVLDQETKSWRSLEPTFVLFIKIGVFGWFRQIYLVTRKSYYIGLKQFSVR